jgi:hypothetical protein
VFGDLPHGLVDRHDVHGRSNSPALTPWTNASLSGFVYRRTALRSSALCLIATPPFTTGAHAGMSGAFALLESGGLNPPLVYMENAGGGLFVETDAEVAFYLNAFQRLVAQAMGPHDTTDLVEQVASTTA